MFGALRPGGMGMFKLVSVVGAVIAMLGSTSMASIVNGDFSGGSTGYFVLESNGLVTFSADQVMLETGAGAEPFTASLFQGDDGTFSFASAITVPDTALFFAFDLVGFDQTAATDEDGSSFFTDGFSVALFDALDLNLDIYSDYYDAGTAFGQILIDVTSLQGRMIAFAVDLFDENDGFDTTVTLDNFQFVLETTTGDPVPLPAAVWLGAFGFAVMTRLGRRKTVAA